MLLFLDTEAGINFRNNPENSKLFPGYLKFQGSFSIKITIQKLLLLNDKSELKLQIRTLSLLKS
ncbi:hypothetical protein DU30_05475 [Methanosarcina mazei]|uniref:Uncharacterized protein n=1 Tax=Methanosarcina mazei TaxID=2209 RepID=A0A0F8GAT6_METMZ|nr:hypothetical protein DU30_05475 [Methanosarcina mazei]